MAAAATGKKTFEAYEQGLAQSRHTMMEHDTAFPLAASEARKNLTKIAQSADVRIQLDPVHASVHHLRAKLRGAAKVRSTETLDQRS
ncbi:hypothetical protein ACFOEZ_10440 [Tianweitania populi]|uniref:Uncharacterized protein n=1 Tax=Tianweitania populi TaxID=1607949 RepID=A0A8J3DSJ8_9HYPH|nr:hypothetical protein [Tianweitania populi]GHD20741.1 hypothetical protein GCM10016234_33320 [Tianweitania populi]